MKSIIIGVDAGSLSIENRKLRVGTHNVSLNLLIYLSKIDKKNTYYLYSFRPLPSNVMLLLGKNFCNRIVTPTRGWASIWLPIAARRDKVNVFLGLNQFLPNLNKKCFQIGVIHDLAFLEFPDFYNKSYNRLVKNTDQLTKRAKKIITVSRFVKRSVVRNYKISGSNIFVVYPGAVAPKSTKTLKERKNFLFVGALKKGKNLPNIIYGFDSYCKSVVSNHKLIIVGGDIWLDEGIEIAVSSLEKEIRKRIIFKGFVSDSHLRKLYSEALLFVSPSLYEGFGLAHAEAMAAGIPIIASNRGSLPEIIGKAGILVDPNSSNEIADALKTVVSNKKKYKNLHNLAIENSKKFTWEKFAKSVYEIIQKYEKKDSPNSRKVSQSIRDASV